MAPLAPVLYAASEANRTKILLRFTLDDLKDIATTDSDDTSSRSEFAEYSGLASDPAIVGENGDYISQDP